jgi:hypothetical protein
MSLTPSQVSVLGFQVSGDLAGSTIYTTRKGKKVVFAQSPPRKPLTVWQLAWQRNFRVGMALWSRMSPSDRLAYRRVCDAAKLCMLGHNLFLHAFLGGDNSTLDTLECQYQIPLRKPPLL